VRVKICGITNLNDAISAIECGADALGFVLYKKSPRYINEEKIKEIIKKLPPFIEKVGLFVNENSSYVNDVASHTKITLAQTIEVKEMNKIQIPYIDVKRIKDIDDIKSLNLNNYNMIDSFTDKYGGAGIDIPKDYFNEIDCSKIILAGGLSTDVLKEIKKYNFYGVDVSSFVEKEPGIKDTIKMRNFIQEAKS